MSIEQLLIDYGIPYVVKGSGHSHATPGWINIHCPFCVGERDFHLGIPVKKPMSSHCWRCGSHSTANAISKILGFPSDKIYNIIKNYMGSTVVTRRGKIEPRVNIYPLKFPQPFGTLNTVGKRYLESRGFDPTELISQWGIQQTGPVSFLDKISYSNRILIPIHWDGELVSFQTRDITGKADRKYMACPLKREVINHKTILYTSANNQKGWNRYPALVVVEGVFDVWRLGPCAAATFGTSIKMEQVLALAKSHDRFFVVFDNESQAQGEARKLAVKLKALGKIVFIETVKTDPGDMDQSEADYFIKYLLGGNQM
ncbi:MAG: DNA primase [Spirochaetes bacterium ADurb.Bin001]|nr:MAG: DNA primase [Spirochaetes bacterium ADurb.Bin001]